MTLHEYLRDQRISYREFGRTIERDGAEVWRWAHGHRTPALDVAVKIETATGGRVSVRDLLPADKADVAATAPPHATHELAIEERQ